VLIRSTSCILLRKRSNESSDSIPFGMRALDYCCAGF
jgi:hypothetical protein